MTNPQDPFKDFTFGGFGIRYAPPPTRRPLTKEQQLEYELATERAKVAHAEQRLREMLKTPRLYLVVAEVGDKEVTVLNGEQMIDLVKPTGEPKLGVGDIVKAAQGPGGEVAIVGVVKSPLAAGPIVTVAQVIDEHACEVRLGPNAQSVPYPAGMRIKAGDRVVLNSTGKVVIKNLGAADTSRLVPHETGVSWDDIGGQDEAKRALREAIEEPYTRREVYERMGQRPPRGVLLYGPPGCGKTMMGKAAATAIAKLHGASARASGFIYAKGPDMLDKFVGETESNIRRLFAQAREHHAEHGYPAVIFLDECDALLGKRGSRAPGFEGIERTVIPQFLSEMDGMFDSGAFVLLATNRPDVLDPAVVRDGRIDRKVHVRRPNKAEAEDIFARALGKRPAEPNLAEYAADALFDGKRALAMVRCKDGNDKRFTLGELASGAIVAGIVDRATQRAIRRALASEGKPEIARADVDEAVSEIEREQRAIDHQEAIADFVRPMGANVVKVEEVRP